MELVTKDSTGKPIFLGQEDPHNTPISQKKGSQMECPVCHEQFDFLLGEGSNQGCEADYKPSVAQKGIETYDTAKEII